MRLLILLLLICSSAHADSGYSTSMEIVYRLSCERTMLRIFAKYGAGDWNGAHQESYTVKYCEGMVQSINKAKAWKDIDSPAGNACMDVVKAISAKKGYPTKEDLFGELCYSITRKDGQ